MLNANTTSKSISVAKNVVACALAAALAIGGPCVAMAAPQVQTPSASASASTTQAEYIGDKAALKVGLKDAKLAKKDCTEVEVELDLDDGTPHYDVSLKSGGREYDYDIDALDGTILHHTVEIDD